NFLPLWVVPWDPAQFDDGRDHVLEVTVTDSARLSTTKRVVFRVDGQRAKSEGMGSGLGGAIILARFSPFFKTTFIVVHLFVVVSLLSLKLYTLHLRAAGTSVGRRGFGSPAGRPRQLSPQPGRVPPYSSVLQRSISSFAELLQWILLKGFVSAMDLVDTPSYFYVLYGYILYVIVGPWFIGSLVPSATRLTDNIGAFYTVGLWFWSDEGWVPMLDTWFYSLWCLLSYFVPLTVFLALRGTLTTSFERSTSWPRDSDFSMYVRRGLAIVAEKTFVALWLAVTLWFGFMAPAYGSLTMLVGPGVTWFWIWGACQ
ncbi:hypothetical protein HK405_002676, partial [Cladochytrium tenue]